MPVFYFRGLCAQAEVEEVADGCAPELDSGVGADLGAAAAAAALEQVETAELHSFEIEPAQVCLP